VARMRKMYVHEESTKARNKTVSHLKHCGDVFPQKDDQQPSWILDRLASKLVYRNLI
jgi:hypothetical protein